MNRDHATSPASLAPHSQQRRAMLRLKARARRREADMLCQALEHDRLTLNVTSRRRLADGVVTAEEAALSWARGDVTAAAALAATANRDVARRIGEWMVRTACARLGAAETLVSVPVSAAMLTPDFPGWVFASLRLGDVPGARLELRLPEAALVQPSTELLLSLSALRDGGVRLALEEFGMRYGSAIMLRNLPLTAVHLDPSLTHGLEDGLEDTRLAASLIAMAHALGLVVVARAVNGAGRAAALHMLGIDEGTGESGRAPLA